MYSKVLVSVAVLLGLVGVIGCTTNSYKLGGCPRVIVMKTLDFDKLVGDWFVVQSFNPMATCTKLTIDKGPEGQYTMNETNRPLGINFGLDHHRTARKLTFLRNDTQSIFRIQSTFAIVALNTFGIVDTDYETYAVIWGCDPLLFGSIQNIDVLSRRDPQAIDKETKENIDKTLTSMKNVDKHSLQNVDHSRCEDAKRGNDDSNNMHFDRMTNNMSVDNKEIE